MIVLSKLMRDFIKAQDSVEKFAERVGVSRQTVYNLLSGEQVSSDMMSKLVEATGITLDNGFEVRDGE